MKILQITPAYIPAYRYGGPIHSVHNMNKGLVQQGVDVTVYTTSANGSDNLDVPLGTPVIMDGVRVYYFKPELLRSWFYSGELWKMLARTAKDFDLIHITSVFLFTSTLGAYYAKKYKKPYIISPRGSLMIEPIAGKSSFLKRWYIWLIERRNLKDAVIHFTADAEKEEYLKLKLPLRDSFIVPNGLDVEKFTAPIEKDLFRNRFHFSKEKEIILFLGRISWKKGFDTLIPAFKSVVEKHNSVLLVIAGVDDEEYKKEIEKLIAELHIGNSVVFVGELLGDVKLAALRESDIFVLSSYSENFGMAVVEAMSSELPVIITEGVAISSDIGRAHAGIVIKKDEKELADAILGLLENKENAREMGKRGREFVKAQFSMERVAQTMRDAYNRVIKEYEATI